MRPQLTRLWALAALTLSFAAAASAQQGDAADMPPEAFMSGEELTEAFTDADLHGCYPNGDPVEERTAADGSLYDLVQDGVLVGDWWVQEDEICYRYTGEHNHPEGVFCWNVARDGGALYFFEADTGQYGGASFCASLIS